MEFLIYPPALNSTINITPILQMRKLKLKHFGYKAWSKDLTLPNWEAWLLITELALT